MAHRTAWASLVFAAFAAGAHAAAGDFPKTPPDLTLSRDVDRTSTYNLGPTGMRGWIFTRAENFLDSVQGRTTTASRQILVTHVGRGSPADGVMQVDDVILGLDGRRFASDPRRALANAIQTAESAGGTLSLVRWRAGRVEEANLRLPVIGGYSTTAPYDCPKSIRILDRAAGILAAEPLTTDIWGAVNGLALLATGDPAFLPRVREHAHALAAEAPAADMRRMGTWEIGYRSLFLCEYHLLTGDADVLPAISAQTLALARGQGRYGTFGHGFADPNPNGGPHGSIPPYGPVNAAGLVANLAIVLGSRCGVTDPEVPAAIARASRFFGYYVDKGSIPYGEHMPWPYHENNGKNSMAAVFFALQGDRPHEARYFSKMATAGYANREYGHTGQGFSYLWGGLGAAAGGPTAAAAFFREASWHYDLVRRSDGSFTYDGDEQFGGGRTDDDTYSGPSSYYGLSPTATYVLAYSLPRRKLLITGRYAAPANALSADDAAAAVAAGRFDVDRATLSVDALLDALGNWSPVVRGWAAEELARRPEARSLVPRLVALVEGPDSQAAQGACETLGWIKAAEAVPVLVRSLVHEDRWLRSKAALALQAVGKAARPAIPDLLRAAAATAEPTDPIEWADPVQISQGHLAETLFKGLLRESVTDVDRGLLHPAVRAVARNADGMARATLCHLLEEQLTADDLSALADDVLVAAKTRCPADTMFGNEIRMAAFRALAKHRYREGIEVGVDLARTQGGHGSESRTGEIMQALVAYGAAARPVVPRLRELIAFFNAEVAGGDFPEGELNARRIGAVETAIAKLEAATDSPSLRSLR